MKQPPIYINHLGLSTNLGLGKQKNLNAILKPDPNNFEFSDIFSPNKIQRLGLIKDNLPEIPKHLNKWLCRNNQIALSAILEIEADIKEAIKKYGKNKVAVIAGTSTSGVKEGEKIFDGGKSIDLDFPIVQEMGSLAEFVYDYLELESFYYTISTACSSAAKIITSAYRLLQSNTCDAVIAIGADTLSALTVQGFDCLEALSPEQTVPFSRNRKGINLGEGAAIMLLSRDKINEGIFVAGYGESSDAHHMSSPDPAGTGAIIAIQKALTMANISNPSKDLQYINLHGTGTPLNDAMESTAIYHLNCQNIPSSSTKALTGHTLGASGIIEAGFCYLTLSELNKQKLLPKHFFDNQIDEKNKMIHLVSKDSNLPDSKTWYTLSNSFAFGGSNCAIIIGRQLEHP